MADGVQEPGGQARTHAQHRQEQRQRATQGCQAVADAEQHVARYVELARVADSGSGALGQAGVNLAAAGHICAGADEQDADGEAHVGQRGHHNRLGTQAQYQADGAEEGDKAERHGQADHHGAADETHRISPVIVLISAANVQAQVGRQHREPAGVDGGCRANGVGEPQLDAHVADAGARGPRQQLNKPVDAVDALGVA